jgi:hypothetical protein
MIRRLLVVAVLSIFMGLPALAGENEVLEFNRMFGVSGPFLGPTNAIRGVPGAGAAWKIASVDGELKANGKLEIRVTGLVLVATGANPVANFRGLVSCQSIDGLGQPSVVNTSTVDFPATTTGDADIEAKLSLPSPCIAPIVFVTNTAGRWFSVTGF